MKIILGFRPTSDSALRHYRLKLYLENLGHQVKTLASDIYFPFVTSITWLTSVLNEKENLEQLEQEINKFEPDLIISDLERWSYKIAKKLNIPIWCYSGSESFLLAVKWISLSSKIRKSKLVQVFLNRHSTFEPDMFLCCSSLFQLLECESQTNFFPVESLYVQESKIESNSKIDLGYIWSSVERYHSLIKLFSATKLSTQILGPATETYRNISANIFNEITNYNCLQKAEIIGCSGESEFLADIIKYKKPLFLMPESDSIDSRINSLVLREEFNVPICWQVEKMQRFANEELVKCMDNAKLVNQIKKVPSLKDYLDDFQVSKGIGHPL